jgi:hypothetical protein
MLRLKSHSMFRSAFGPTVLAAGLLTGGSGGGTGHLRPDPVRSDPLTSDSPLDSTITRFPTRLDGAFWARLTPGEKQIYLQGFVAGAAAEQATAADAPADSLRSRHALHFAFTPTVYAAQIDDFYWWQNHSTTPIVEAMRQINGTR